MKKILQGKNILITGTGRGMGQAMLKAFAAYGANIWAHARAETEVFKESCQELAQQHQVQIWPVCFELTDYGSMKEAVRKIRSFKIPVDGLVNNAGITYNALFQMSDMKNAREQMEVNFFAPYQLTQLVVKIMVQNKRGSIVNIASTAGLDGNAGKSAYGASKAALAAMTKSVAQELGPAGIRANCIAPGVTDTQMLLTMPGYIVEGVKSQADLRRVGKPDEIADAAAFLVSDLSSYITGQVIRVDGGM